MIFAVAGGDRRQAALAGGLAAGGHEVRCHAVPDMPDLPLSAALHGAEVLILPLPAFRDGVVNGCAVTLPALLEARPVGMTVYGGKLDGAADALRAAGHPTTDYAALPALAEKNAIPSAEGAIQLAMERLPITLFGCRCLIIGYGRIGRALAARMRALGADVTVSARRATDFAAIRAAGLQADETGVYTLGLGQYQLIFNTVPALVLPPKKLAALTQDCLVIDLASTPGGVDRDFCAAKAQPFCWALGLPGKVAPVTAGLLLRDVILEDLTS